MHVGRAAEAVVGQGLEGRLGAAQGCRQAHVHQNAACRFDVKTWYSSWNVRVGVGRTGSNPLHEALERVHAAPSSPARAWVCLQFVSPMSRLPDVHLCLPSVGEVWAKLFVSRV